MNNSIAEQLQELQGKNLIQVDEPHPVVQKFINLNKKVKVNSTDLHYSFDELVNKVPMNILRTRIITINQIINNLEPGINSDVMFSHYTEDGVCIDFTWKEVKEFIIQAIKEKEKSSKYKTIRAKHKKAVEEHDIKTVIKLSSHL